ncbi:MAG: hypothetical protein R3282_09760, partial [Rhodothermales bacterium]|nr:hypothetical protein [Rhodothermales bacterium]
MMTIAFPLGSGKTTFKQVLASFGMLQVLYEPFRWAGAVDETRLDLGDVSGASEVHSERLARLDRGRHASV